MAQALTTYDEKWATMAQKAAEAEPVNAGTWLSARGGELVIGGEALPGAQAAVIIIDSFNENTYYEGKYNPEEPMPPVCYAAGRDGETMFPSEAMQVDLNYFQPQHMDGGTVLGCQGCPMNQWGSAAQGRGKACQNRRRLTLIPAGQYVPRERNSRDLVLEVFDDARHFEQADIAFFKIPVTSVKNWAKYVHQLATSVRRPPAGVMTRLAIVPHAENQIEVTFEMLDLVPDSLADIVIGRRQTAEALPMPVYLPPEDKGRQRTRQGNFRDTGRR